MAQRYVSTSEMTTIVAKGILLYARAQNMTAVVYIGSEAEREWKSWCATYPEWENFIRKEQTALFDKVNNYR